jgi:prefoldin subunit 5
VTAKSAQAETIAGQGQGTDGSVAGGAGRPKGLRRGFVGLALGIVVIIGLVFALPVTRDRIAALLSSPEPPPPVTAARVDGGSTGAEIGAMAQRLGRLEKTLSRLGDDIAALKAAPAADEGAASADTQGAIQSLQRRLVAIEARPTAAPDAGASIEALDKRLDGLAKTISALEARVGRASTGRNVAGREVKQTLALMALANALRRGAPFQALAGPARAVMVGSENDALADRLDALARYAEKGVPGRASLASRFAALPRSAEKSPPPAGPKPAGADEGKSIWDRVAARVKGLVKIRKVGGNGAPPVKAGPWAAASKAMVAGNLGAAVAALQGAGNGEVAAWRRDARARIEVDAIADALDTLTAARLGAKSDNP